MRISGKKLLAGVCALLIVSGSVSPMPLAQLITTSITASAAEAPSSTVNDFVVTDGGLSSSNYNYYYGNWAYNINSYLYECDDGTLTRVEYKGGTVYIDNYKKDGTYVYSKVIDCELAQFGGFYSGSEYNFIVFGQSNTSDSNDVEVARVVKYDKNWNRLASVSISGVNSHGIFEAGSLRMTETGGNLFIHTCTTMYKSSDGLNHQANKKFIVDIANMTYKVDGTGYSSHSFNQYIITDGTYVYCVDHGDAYDRAIQLTRRSADLSSTTYKKVHVMDFGGSTGNNYTGCKVGGFEYSSNNLLICGSTVDQSLWEDNNNNDDQYNVFVTVTDKASLGTTKTVWLTDYPNIVNKGSASAVTVSTARMVKASDDRFLVMWTETQSSTVTKIAVIDGSGNQVYDTVEYEGNIISECQPILCEDGLIRWYSTTNSTPRIYTLDPSRPNPVMKDIANADITPDECFYNFGDEVKPDAAVVYNGNKLTKGVDYTVTYSDNINVSDSSTMTITGMGSFEGSKTVPFTISPRDINDCQTVSAGTSVTYTGSEVLPTVRITGKSGYEYDYDAGRYKYYSVTLVQDTDYTLTGRNNINATDEAAVIIKGQGNYTGTMEKTFAISPRSLGYYTTITLDPARPTYDGTPQEPALTVTDNGIELTAGKDYDYEFTDNVNAGSYTATVTVTGKGNYQGEKTKTFSIAKKSLSDEDVVITVDPDTVEYDGTAKEPAVTVKIGDRVLEKDTDYTVRYYSNTNVGKATVYVYGQNNYTGTNTKTTFKIVKFAEITEDDVTLSPAAYTYDGTEKKPAVTVKVDGATLTGGEDYTLSYDSNINAGTATVTVTGTGAYRGAPSKTFTIYAKALNSDNIALTPESYEYDGTAKTPAVTVKDGDNTLTEGKDYDLSFSNNTDVGTATVVVTGKGNYRGIPAKSFTITAKTLTAENITISPESYEYDGTAKEPAVTVRVGRTTLTPGDDYTVAYTQNVEAGTATVTVTGKGNYTGTPAKTFTVTAKALADENVTVTPASVTYNGTAQKPAVTVKVGDATLTEGTDYTVAYAKNTNAGTAEVTVTGKGNYTGTANDTFKITAKDISAAEVTVSPETVAYDGTAKTPEVTVTIGGMALTADDYTLTFENNVNAGTAAVTVTGKGNYTGTAAGSFTITAKELAAENITLSPESYEYDGTAKEPAVTVKVGENTLTPNDDYTVAYSDNTKAGTATVTVTGKGNYSGAPVKSFTITAKELTAENITLSPESYEFDGTAKTPAVTVKVGENTLTEGDDYTVAYSDNTKAGTATVTVTGKGNYSGAPAKTFEISFRDIAETDITITPESFVYDGTEKTPAVTLKLGEYTLTDEDCTVTFANNINAGTAAVTVEGKGSFTGQTSASFTITPKALTAESVTLEPESFIYDGTEKAPAVTVTDGDKVLSAETDYTAVTESLTEVGSAIVTVTGKGNYTGTVEKTFRVAEKELKDEDVTLSEDTFTYDGTEKKPVITVTVNGKTLTAGEDYSVTVTNNTEAGEVTVTVKGQGEYAGTVTKTFTITAKDISTAAAELAQTDLEYDGTPKTPAVTVKDGDTTLTEDTDYTVEYSDNTEVGEGKVLITGIGNYKGNIDLSFNITQAQSEPENSSSKAESSSSKAESSSSKAESSSSKTESSSSKTESSSSKTESSSSKTESSSSAGSGKASKAAASSSAASTGSNTNPNTGEKQGAAGIAALLSAAAAIVLRKKKK